MKALLILGCVVIGMGHLAFLLPAAITALCGLALYKAGFAGHGE